MDKGFDDVLDDAFKTNNDKNTLQTIYGKTSGNRKRRKVANR